MGELKKLRVVDPHATQLVSGYRSRITPVINKIFPIVDVTSEAGKFMNFGAYAHLLRTGLERALGDNRKRISITVGEGSYNTNEVSIEGAIPDRAIRNTPESRRQNLRDKWAESLQETHLLGMEFAAATIIKDPAKYAGTMTTALTGTNQWKDAASTPIKNLRSWLRLVSKATLIPINELSVGLASNPMESLLDHANVQERVKYTGKEADGAEIAGILRCKEVFELNGMYVDDIDPDDLLNVQGIDIFGDEVVVFHEVADPDASTPLVGGIARVEGYPMVTEYRDESRSSDITAVDDNYGVFLNGATIRKMFLARDVSGL